MAAKAKKKAVGPERIDIKLAIVPIDELLADPDNARFHDEANIAAIMDSLQLYGQVKPVVCERDSFKIIAGSGTLEAARRLGWLNLGVNQSGLEGLAAAGYGIADNRTAELAKWNDEALSATLKRLDKENYDLDKLHFGKDDLARLLGRETQPPPAPTTGGLSERFLMPPFSVLDARQGYWQDRKREWLSLGIASEVGRGENLLKFSETVQMSRKKDRKGSFGNIASWEGDKAGSGSPQLLVAEAEMAGGRRLTYGGGLRGHSGDLDALNEKTGTSIFDPVLCELAYTWFSGKGAHVLDPFAGGSVRGIVAAKLGRHYQGIDLRQEQVDANWQQAEAIFGAGYSGGPAWLCGDSLKVLDTLREDNFDMILSCPPYADLEVYSDDPADISNMPYDQFLDVYSDIILKSVAKLRNHRFIVWVIGDVREKKGGGFYRGFVPDTIRAFESAGARLYNEAILVTAVGTLPLRTSRSFPPSRKLGKAHQNVLVFCKGDPAKAAQAAGEIEVWQPSKEELEAAEAGEAAAGFPIAGVTEL